jgi:hypothetical protein
MNANITWQSARTDRKVKGAPIPGELPDVGGVEVAGVKLAPAKVLPLPRRLSLAFAALWIQVITVLFIIFEVGQRVRTPVAEWFIRLSTLSTP